MMRSLFSGVSGLKAHQTGMDTIGNNIANVNTTGFKASRTTFADTLSQTLTGASAPGDSVGGTNPKQIGLGTGVASVDLIFTDGSVQSTGKNTDLCLSGNGLFVVKNGSETYYTRDGAFEFDANGNYVLPSSGLYVQGWTATDGKLNTTGAVGNITIAAGKSMEAKQTATVTYTNNLNASTTGYTIASILATYSDGTSETLTSYPSSTHSTGKISLTLHDTTSNTDRTITLDDTAGYDFTTDYVAGTKINAGKVLCSSTITSVTANGTGAGATLNVSKGKGMNSITGLTTVDVTSGTYTPGGTYTITGTIDKSGVTTSGTNTGETTLRVTLNDANSTQVTITVPEPTSFSYSDGDTVSFDLNIDSIDAEVGATVATKDGNSETITSAVTGITSTTAYEYKVGADETVKTVTRTSDSPTVTITTTDGQTLTGLGNKTYAKGDTFYPSVTTTATIYGSQGRSYSVPILFTKNAANTWSLSLNGGSTSGTVTADDGTTANLSLSTTDLVFDANGKYVSGSATLIVTPLNGEDAPQSVAINLAALTQYAGNSTINATSDGNSAGTLSSVSVDSSGVITGTYTNGIKQTEAQVAIAQFTNASGLTKTGNSLYQESNNSGTANVKTAADLGCTITPSALEMSTVDIANEFSNMIVTQRGFQSNSKIITVSDEMLETLINMKR